MEYKICPKCLESSLSGLYCGDCGTKLVDWNLKCSCGALLPPYLKVSYFPWCRRTDKPREKFCPECGCDTTERVKLYVKAIKLLAA